MRVAGPGIAPASQPLAPAREQPLVSPDTTTNLESEPAPPAQLREEFSVARPPDLPLL